MRTLTKQDSLGLATSLLVSVLMVACGASQGDQDGEEIPDAVEQTSTTSQTIDSTSPSTPTTDASTATSDNAPSTTSLTTTSTSPPATTAPVPLTTTTTSPSPTSAPSTTYQVETVEPQVPGADIIVTLSPDST